MPPGWQGWSGLDLLPEPSPGETVGGGVGVLDWVNPPNPSPTRYPQSPPVRQTTRHRQRRTPSQPPGVLCVVCCQYHRYLSVIRVTKAMWSSAGCFICLYTLVVLPSSLSTNCTSRCRLIFSLVLAAVCSVSACLRRACSGGRADLRWRFASSFPSHC